MANLKSITELPVAESAEGLNLIVNDNGAAKQIPASSVGAQADWAETDENSPAFIKNKPVEELDLDLSIDITWNAETSGANEPVITVADGYSFEAFAEKVEANKIPNVRVLLSIANESGAMSEIVKPYGVVKFNGGYALVWFSGATSRPLPVVVIISPDGAFSFMIMG